MALVRQAVPEDAAEIQSVAAASARTAYEPIVDDLTLVEAVESGAFVADLHDWLAETRDTDQVVYLVAVDDGIVGFVQLQWGVYGVNDYVGESEALLHSLYVTPDHWGNGIGSELLTAAIDRIPSNLTAVVLGVIDGNDRAFRFYDRHGFEKREESTYEVDGVAYPVDVYARPL